MIKSDEQYRSTLSRFQKLKARLNFPDKSNENDNTIRLIESIDSKLLIYEQAHGIVRKTEPTSSPSVSNGTSNENFSAFNASNFSYKDTSWNPDFNDYAKFTASGSGAPRKYAARAGEKNFWDTYSSAADDLYPSLHHKKSAEHLLSETRSTDELLHDLGILYVIFGSEYITHFSYHTYSLCFLNRVNQSEAFERVLANVYEDGKLICEQIVISFWPFHKNDIYAGDMEWSISSYDCFIKYHNGISSYLDKILQEMQDYWNIFFDQREDIPMLENGGTHKQQYISNDNHSYHSAYPIPRGKEENHETGVELTADERHAVIATFKPHNGHREFQIGYPLICDLSLTDLLVQSGLVYAVTKDGIFIWDKKSNLYHRLLRKKYVPGTYFTLNLYLDAE